MCVGEHESVNVCVSVCIGMGKLNVCSWNVCSLYVHEHGECVAMCGLCIYVYESGGMRASVNVCECMSVSMEMGKTCLDRAV